jgi:autotransporter passenger strand-loop-strand repeat protein
VASGGQEVVSSGGAASGTTVLSGGGVYVRVSGEIFDALVSNGGKTFISSGGIASGTTLLSGGSEYISSGGVARGTDITSGGQGHIDSGGIASGTTVGSHGRETISSGGEVRGLSLSAGGVVVDDGEVRIAGAATLGGVLSGSGVLAQTAAGDLLLSGSDAAFTGLTVIEAGTVELATAGALGTGNVQFIEPTTGSAVLQIDAADAPAAGGTFANTIDDFSGANEDIDLRSIAFVSGASASVSGGVLTLTDGGKTYKFNLAGTTAGAYPVLSDGHGGTLIDPVAPRTSKPGAGEPKATDPGPVRSQGARLRPHRSRLRASRRREPGAGFEHFAAGARSVPSRDRLGDGRPRLTARGRPSGAQPVAMSYTALRPLGLR